MPPVPSSPVETSPPQTNLFAQNDQKPPTSENTVTEERQEQRNSSETTKEMVGAAAKAPLATEENVDEYAEPQKNKNPSPPPTKELDEIKENTADSDVDTTDAAMIRRSNTIGNMPPAERPRSQIMRRNTAEPAKTTTSRSKEALLPGKDVVYQHTTNVVKSVIEFNTGVQHATPDEFVDLVKV